MSGGWDRDIWGLEREGDKRGGVEGGDVRADFSGRHSHVSGVRGNSLGLPRRGWDGIIWFARFSRPHARRLFQHSRRIVEDVHTFRGDRGNIIKRLSS